MVVRESAPAATTAPDALRDAAARPQGEVLERVGSGPEGLSSSEAAARLATVGPNAIRGHRARPWRVLGRQLKSPILLLLLVTAIVSAFVGDAANSVIIFVILVVSVGLGFVNEFRAERAADALHDRVRYNAVVTRDGARRSVDVVDLVPGDVVALAVGSVVPADIRLLVADDLLCDESIVTGESLPVAKSPQPTPAGAALGDLSSCVLMGTVVQSGGGTGVVVATGPNTEFGRIAVGLGTQQPQTEFQRGLGRFSLLLLEVALVLTTVIFVANLLLQRPLIESLLFSLAIAVGITPQLLPAVVSTSLATGSRALAKRRVLVKRLVCIEDLGDLDMLVTDKTGTLTEGRISFTSGIAVDGVSTSGDVVELGLLATETDYSVAGPSTVGLNALDTSLWESDVAGGFDPAGHRKLATLPFDHERRMTSVLITGADGRTRLVSKGAPEDLMRRCVAIPPAAQSVLDTQYEAGARVVAVAVRDAVPGSRLTPDDEHGLTLVGLLVFVDRPKADASASLERLAELGIAVKIATGDNAKVAEKVCADLGMTSGGTLVGDDIDRLNDDELADAAKQATIFARVSPEQKARIITQLRQKGRAVGFLGDGVNDALALHRADIGISVESAADVAKDAADVLLLDKDLSVLADGVMEGRRIFANTIKYVLMGTSSNFGNMFSASIASIVLPFLPMLPGQILLNNLLYDTGQLAIPTDRVDREQLQAPAHWDIAYIRRFMLLFGPISSLFDFATFALMIFVFSAAPAEFRTGWFIESIATQTLIIFAIRTRRVPFFRSRPSLALVLASLSVVAVGAWLPFSPLAGVLGFAPIPLPFLLAVVGMIVAYLVLVEFAKAWFFARAAQRPPSAALRRRGYQHRVGRRAARFTAKSPQAAG
ncbi:magnesium-translocating P-type ATPase [Leifsonia poae]|uniref:Magnesium-transporting ATPase, P-type 1 n=1 Tax=Leifsonia poae TaxID=110933 RepID=A0A9W6HAH0_9MICO|nr:magnesium-translocating P-type ATPase [Leifsonia poae]GLJ76525.1 magnesium-translocating P-type ATPase [Leifsonia poae]